MCGSHYADSMISIVALFGLEWVHPDVSPDVPFVFVSNCMINGVFAANEA